MALIIEDGTGVSSADSYATRAGYITFADDYYGETVADEDASDAPLRRAYAYMRSLPWKTSADYPTFDGTIPQAVKNAQIEFARAEAASVGVLSPQGSLRDSAINKEKVDVIEVGYDTSRLPAGVEAAEVFVSAGMRWIAEYLVNGGKPGARITDVRVV
jgi:hypothetical protein